MAEEKDLPQNDFSKEASTLVPLCRDFSSTDYRVSKFISVDKEQVAYSINLEGERSENTLVDLTITKEGEQKTIDALKRFPGYEKWPSQKRIQIKTTVFTGEFPNRKSTSSFSDPTEKQLETAKNVLGYIEPGGIKK